jgi:hypothetical protein
VDDEHRSALLLTEQEWSHLADVCSYYLMATDEGSSPQRDIARRVMEAADR